MEGHPYDGFVSVRFEDSPEVEALRDPTQPHAVEAAIPYARVPELVVKLLEASERPVVTELDEIGHCLDTVAGWVDGEALEAVATARELLDNIRKDTGTK